MKKFEKRVFQLLTSTVLYLILIILNLVICTKYAADRNYSIAVIPLFLAIWFLIVVVMKIIIFHIDQRVHELSEKIDFLTSKNLSIDNSL